MKVMDKYIKKAIDSSASMAKIIDANKIVTSRVHQYNLFSVGLLFLFVINGIYRGIYNPPR